MVPRALKVCLQGCGAAGGGEQRGIAVDEQAAILFALGGERAQQTLAPARLREPHEQNEGAARAQVERGDGQARAAEKRQVLRVKAERGFPVRGGLCVQHRRTEGEIAGRRLLIGQFGEGGMVLPAAIRPAPHLSTIRHGEGIRPQPAKQPGHGQHGVGNGERDGGDTATPLPVADLIGEDVVSGCGGLIFADRSTQGALTVCRGVSK